MRLELSEIDVPITLIYASFGIGLEIDEALSYVADYFGQTLVRVD